MAEERNVEEYIIGKVKSMGGKCYKFVSPGNNGVPDRIVMLPPGRVYFVETKAAGQKPRPSQLAVHREMESIGVRVWVLDSKAAADEFLREVAGSGIHSAQVPEHGDREDL